MVDTRYLISLPTTMTSVRKSSSGVTMTSIYIIIALFHISTVWMTVDGFLIPHRKDEVPDDLNAQQLGGYWSNRPSDVKKGKKGVGSRGAVFSPVLAPSPCGVTPVEPNVNHHIVGSAEVIPHSWPWMVSLQHNGEHKCSGSLIDSQWVLTAANCLPIFRNLTVADVVVGSHVLGSPDWTDADRIAVREIIVEPKYLRESSIRNAAMLIKLARPVSFSGDVLPVCLPKPFHSTESGTKCWSLGWETVEREGRVSSVLKQLAVTPINNQICNLPQWYDEEIDDNIICAVDEHGGEDSCQDDIGGPLVCKEVGRWILYGVATWNTECARSYKPLVFTRASALVRWISGEIEENLN